MQRTESQVKWIDSKEEETIMETERVKDQKIDQKQKKLGAYCGGKEEINTERRWKRDGDKDKRNNYFVKCFVICDPFCQNETLLCTWSKLSLVYY